MALAKQYLSVLILQARLCMFDTFPCLRLRQMCYFEVRLTRGKRGGDGGSSLITSVFPLCHSRLEVAGTFRRAVQSQRSNMKRLWMQRFFSDGQSWIKAERVLLLAAWTVRPLQFSLFSSWSYFSWFLLKKEFAFLGPLISFPRLHKVAHLSFCH